jgi:hypothetical protein
MKTPILGFHREDAKGAKKGEELITASQADSGAILNGISKMK